MVGQSIAPALDMDLWAYCTNDEVADVEALAALPAQQVA